MLALYLPSWHAVHDEPEPSKFSGQPQSAISSLPVSEVVLTGHATHADPPVTLRYVPTGQAVHAWPKPSYPLRQLHTALP